MINYRLPRPQATRTRAKVLEDFGYPDLPASQRQTLALSGTATSDTVREMRDWLQLPEAQDRFIALSGDGVVTGAEQQSLPKRIVEIIHELIAGTHLPANYRSYIDAEFKLRNELLPGGRDSTEGMRLLRLALKAWARAVRFQLPQGVL